MLEKIYHFESRFQIERLPARNVIRICDKWNIVLSLVSAAALPIAAGAQLEVVFGLLVSLHVSNSSVSALLRHGPLALDDAVV